MWHYVKSFVKMIYFTIITNVKQNKTDKQNPHLYVADVFSKIHPRV